MVVCDRVRPILLDMLVQINKIIINAFNYRGVFKVKLAKSLILLTHEELIKLNIKKKAKEVLTQYAAEVEKEGAGGDKIARNCRKKMLKCLSGQL